MLCWLLPLLIRRANDVVAESQSPCSMLATPAANDADDVARCRAAALAGWGATGMGALGGAFGCGSGASGASGSSAGSGSVSWRPSPRNGGNGLSSAQPYSKNFISRYKRMATEGFKVNNRTRTWSLTKDHGQWLSSRWHERCCIDPGSRRCPGRRRPSGGR